MHLLGCPPYPGRCGPPVPDMPSEDDSGKQHRLRLRTLLHSGEKEQQGPAWSIAAQSKYLNDRAENSHQPTGQRKHAMEGFGSVGGAQRFLSAFSGISPHVRPRRHLMTAAAHRAEMGIRFAILDQITGGLAQIRPPSRHGAIGADVSDEGQGIHVLARRPVSFRSLLSDPNVPPVGLVCALGRRPARRYY